MSNFKSQIKEAFGNLKQVFVRYPMACVSAALFSACLCVFVYYVGIVYNIDSLFISEGVFYSVMWGSLFSVLLCFTAELFCHLRKVRTLYRVLWNAGAVLAAAAGGWLLHAQFSSGFFELYVFVLLFVALTLMVAVPTLGQRNSNMTWNYHIRLLFAIVAVAIVAPITLCGVDAILASIKFLFNVTVQTAIVISIGVVFGFLCPCCAMALMPIDREAYDRPLIYNKFMKVVIQYILLPLVCIEAVVLYIFTLTILINWELPQGNVAYLVFSYAIAGTFVWYLLRPVFRSEPPSKLRFLEKGYFISLLPLLVLLFVGIFRRLHDYSLTSARYIVLAGACWLTVASVLMLVKKDRNVTPLLMSLPAIALLLLIGPWSIISLPEKVQMNRFEKIATEYHLLENGKIVTPKEPLTREQNIQLSRSFDFFHTQDQYMCDVAERYFGISHAEADSIYQEGNTFLSYLLRNDLFAKMKAVYIPDYRDTDHEPTKQSTYYDFYGKNENWLYNISDYDYTFCCNQQPWAEDRIYNYQSGETKILVNILEKDIRFRINGKDFTINVIDSLQLNPYLEVEIAQEDIFSHNHYTLPATRIEHEESNFKFAMEINNIGIEKDTLGKLKIEDVRFNGFMKVR